MAIMQTHLLQHALAQAGFYTGSINNIPGPEVDAAVSAYKRSIGFNPRPYVGPMTLERLGIEPGTLVNLPWMNEAAKMLGAHERRNNSLLSRWLRSDRSALGDPSKLPWCGDFVETAIKLTLPGEPFPGRVGANPYLARNWQDFGERAEATFYGAIVGFWRGKRSGISGHVGFINAIDTKRGRVEVRGGNQRNMASDAWLDSKRQLFVRWPSTYTGPKVLADDASSAGARLSRNEA